MHPDDTVERTIRNQRFRFLSAGMVALVAWAGAGFGLILLFETQVRYGSLEIVMLFAVVPLLGSYVLVIRQINRDPVRWLKLGDEMGGRPWGRLKPKDVDEIRFARDPDEDYVEKSLPIPLCEVTVVPRRGRSVQIIVSIGDAARVREWAECKSIRVVDPDGYSTRATTCN